MGSGTSFRRVWVLRQACPGWEGVIPKGEPAKGYRPDSGFAREGERCGGTKAVEAIEYLGYGQGHGRLS